jgi:hypothetical protein
MHLEHIELKVFDIAERERVVLRESGSVESELDSIVTIFTPTLEEAFAHVDDDPLTDPHLRESPGTNDELFRVAREKYNYLLKKLIPRMSNLVDECELAIRDMTTYAATHPAILGKPTVERWNKCSNTLSNISTSLQSKSRNILASGTYSNLMVLLASTQEAKPVKRSRPEDPNIDKEYEDWF